MPLSKSQSRLAQVPESLFNMTNVTLPIFQSSDKSPSLTAMNPQTVSCNCAKSYSLTSPITEDKSYPS